MSYQDPYAPRNPNQLFEPPRFDSQGAESADTLAQIQALAPYIGATFPPVTQQPQQQQSSGGGGSLSGLLSLFG